MSTFSKNSAPNLKMLTRIKVYQQETPFSCGAAVVRTLFDYYGMLRNRSEVEVCKKLGTRFKNPYPGTHPDKMIDFLKSEGLNIESGENSHMKLIYHYVDQDIPVIVLDSSWGGHWRLIIGYDQRNNCVSSEDCDVYIADPEHEATSQKVTTYEGVVVEKEQQFYTKWFEATLYERVRNRYYIVAYPKDRNIVRYSDV